MKMMSLPRTDLSLVEKRAERQPKYAVAMFLFIMLIVGLILGLIEAPILTSFSHDNPGAILFQAG